ncbi:microcystin degradation protein MlrC [Amycolatopsis sp. AA4]|uniref:M81 family metallopeptidase n=1 Tax=Actinomycetes TaxID=1760 RepID=UPI0001B57B52|nr:MULTISPECIES: M81 family metallopeptidase [Actinomycetes]ATY14274.1 microcystin degradation protein MlrC [Amycolatopsis sp. AA4]EFL10343.1 MlrC domain-containing protein [Streptomyces sp. AA4]
MKKLRVGITGIAIESSTFSPHQSTVDDFRVLRGEDLLGRYDFLDADWAAEVEWVPLVDARSLPGGAVTEEAYAELSGEILDRLRSAGELDGLFFDIHGAMSVVGRSDVEASLAQEIRAIVGPDVLVSASMDLHGNVSRELVAALDLITCYRMAPHEDAWETRERAARNLVSRLRSGGRPKKAWVQVPVLLPGEKTSTRLEPAKSVYAAVDDVEALDGVLDAAIWVGYAWADEPRCQAAVVVMGDDVPLIAKEAERLAQSYWDARHDFAFVAPTGTLQECLAQAVASDSRPFFISDSGDNPTAGGAGDTSWSLDVLLNTPAIVDSSLTTLYAAIVDPEAVATAVAAGVGATISVELGGKVDSGPHGPVALTAQVAAIDADDPVAGTAVALAVGGLRVIVTARRKPYHLESDFLALGLRPREADVVIVKIGYLEPELYAMAADWLLALTPGGVDQDLLRLGHSGIVRPMFPFDADMAPPRSFPRSSEHCE